MHNEESSSFLLVDSHAHLGMKDFDPDRDQVLDRARQAGLGAVLCPGEITDPLDLKITQDLAARHSDVFAVAGVHPHHAGKFQSRHKDTLEELGRTKKIKGIGEIGLDFHYNYSSPQDQESVFRTQLQLAEELDLPVVIHSRNARDSVLKAVHDVGFTRGGVLHCFTEDLEFAEQMMDLGFSISFSGIVTFPKAYGLRQIARAVPMDRLLIETDSPFLAPVPHRGKVKRNEPAFVQDVAECLASLNGTTVKTVAEETSRNFRSLFLIEFQDSRC